MAQKQLHIKQFIETRPIQIYTEFEDLCEKDFENLKRLEERYTNACEAVFTDILKQAIEEYCITGKVPTLGEAIESFYSKSIYDCERRS